MAHIPFDKNFYVDVQVDYLRKKMFGLKLNKHQFQNDLDTSLTFNQYIPWEDKVKFQQDIVNLIHRWTIKRAYGSIQIEEKSSKQWKNSCQYVFTISMGSVDYFNLKVHINLEWKKTWLDNMMTDCDEQLSKLIKALIFSVKEDYTYTEDYLREMDQAIAYIPGVEYRSNIENYHVYLVIDEDGTKYIINLTNGTDQRGSIIQIKTNYYVMRFSFDHWHKKRGEKGLKDCNLRIWEFDDKWQQVFLNTLNQNYCEDHS